MADVNPDDDDDQADAIQPPAPVAPPTPTPRKPEPAEEAAPPRKYLRRADTPRPPPTDYVRVLGSFADAVWLYRAKQKISQRQFAVLAGVHWLVVKRMEDGSHRILLGREARAIADIAGITDTEKHFREVP